MEMNQMIRNILAFIGGLIVGSIVNMGLIALGGKVISPPSGVDVTDMESLKSFMHLFEARHFLFPFLAHAIGTFAGAYVASWVAVSHKMKFAIGVAAFFLIGGIVNIFIMSFIIIAPTEELLKFFAVKRWIYRSLEFDEVMDGIVYTVAASLGFATVENVLYVLQNGITTGIARAFLAIPGHTFFGALMGYYIGRAKFNKEHESKLILKGVLLAIFFHGLYDFLLFTQTLLALLVIVLIIGLGLHVRKHLRKAEFQSKKRLADEAEEKNQMIIEEQLLNKKSMIEANNIGTKNTITKNNTPQNTTPPTKQRPRKT